MSVVEQNMVVKWVTVVVALFLGLALHSTDSQMTQTPANAQCFLLKKSFPTCECRSADEEGKTKIESIVDCSNQGLTQVPTLAEPYHKKFYKLILSKNNIQTLTKDSFNGISVENLDLSDNSINSVDNDTFVGLATTLKTLYIEGDGTSEPPIDGLNKLNLLSLTLKHYDVPVIDTHHNFFISFIYLKELTIDTWNLDHIEVTAFLGLDQLESLTITNQPSLMRLPTGAFNDHPLEKLETLRFTQTSIDQVSNQAFQKLSSLKHLDLSNNKINKLESGCFFKVEDTLETINLQRNEFNDNSNLEGLSAMTALKQLDLTHNTFEKLPRLTGLHADNQINLLLKNNIIDTIQENAFNGYASSVKSLDLRQNFIRQMHSSSFDGVINLKSINLRDQLGKDPALLQVPESLKQSASTLELMDLSGNQVDAATLWPVISQLTFLRTLNLNAVEVNIPDLAFINLNSLEYLDLSYNELTAINQQSLAGLINLKQLDLAGNQIQTIPSCLYHGFISNSITINLGQNPIKCDCKIKQFVRDLKSGKILQDENNPAKCQDDTTRVSSLDPNVLTCQPAYQEPDCIEHYTTAPPQTSDKPVTGSVHVIRITVTDISINKLTATWTISNIQNLLRYRFIVKTTKTDTIKFTRDNLPPSTTQEEANGLYPDTSFTICVTAYFSGGSRVVDCVNNRTKTENPNKNPTVDPDSNSADTAIIVGCVVAGVALIGVVIAVVVLLVCRNKPKKDPADTYAPPTQPRNFAKAELPSMTDDSRTFAKAKKNSRNSHPPAESMQVVAISDGQTGRSPTSPGPRVGRVNQMFQPEEGYEHMTNFNKKEARGSYSNYENDHGKLPPTPGADSIPPSYPGTYYNQGFSREDTYDDIEVAI